MAASSYAAMLLKRCMGAELEHVDPLRHLEALAAQAGVRPIVCEAVQVRARPILRASERAVG